MYGMLALLAWAGLTRRLIDFAEFAHRVSLVGPEKAGRTDGGVFGCDGSLGSFRIAPWHAGLRSPRAGATNERSSGRMELERPEAVQQKRMRAGKCHRSRHGARSKSAYIGVIGVRNLR